MSQDTKVKQLIVNQLSKEQYKQAKLDNILSNTELYIITDDYHYTEQEIQSILSTKQDKLTTSGKINIDENNVISVDLSDYDSTLGSGLEYENSVLTLVSKDGKVLSNVTIKSTPDVDDTTIHLNNGEQLEVIGNVTKDGTTKYDWIGTKEEYEQGLSSGLITDTTTCFITDDEQDLITGGEISIPTKLSQFANDTNFVNSEILNNSIATKVDKVEGKSLIDDTEIIRLSGVNNYDDTEIKQILNNKVDKIDGKSLIDDTEIVRLSGINNYDDTSIVNNITSLQLNKSNTSLNNLTPEGEKHFLNYSQVTNCITEIPQDIKLELKDGTLTIKAGSKVYVPSGKNSDGSNKFNEVILQENVVINWNLNRTGDIVAYNPTTGELAINTATYSGSVAPTSGIFYNTETNLVYDIYTNHNVSGYSLPLCKFSSSSTGVTSIDQTFNGFGYIGSTAFVLPNVKGLIPNGRNADGSLRNIEFIVDKVVTRTITWNNSAGQELFIGKYNLNEGIQFISTGSLSQYYQQEDEPSLIRYTVWYKPTENKVYRCDLDSNGNLIWKDNFPCYIGRWFTSATSPYPITSLTLKLPFRAVEYSDKSEVSSWGMPSRKYIDLTLGATETEYTSPANGWINIVLKANGGIGWVGVKYDAVNFISVSPTVTERISVCIPIKKGTKFTVGYGNCYAEHFRFIYAESET